MATIAPTHSATPSVQSMLLQSRIEQARREADQAESHARQLRAQADDEQRKADQGHGTVRQLTAQQQVASNRSTERNAPQTDASTSQRPKMPPSADPTYQTALRPVQNPPPARVENPRSYQTVAIAKSINSFLAQSGEVGSPRVTTRLSFVA